MQRKIYDADHEAFRVMIRDFIAAELSPYYMEWEHDHIVPRDFFRKLGAIGVTGDTSDNDEACALAAIEAAGLVAKT